MIGCAALISRVRSLLPRRLACPDATLRTRGYRRGDERSIIRLFRRTFRKRKSLDRWEWEFRENPYGKVNIALLESDKSGIVGHYGGILVRFGMRGETIPASQLVDVMIDAAFRGRATLDRLGHAYIDITRANDVKLIYGFNEAIVARSNRRFFRAELAAISDWRRELSHGENLGESIDLEIRSVADFGAEVDDLWQRIKTRYPCATIRDSRYLNWRYSRRSDREYVLWKVADRSSARVVAVVALGTSGPDGLILELLANPDETDTISALLRAIVRHFAKDGRRRVRAWLSDHGQLRQCATAAGFRPMSSGFYLNLLPLDATVDLAALKKDFYYTLGDYDVF